MKSISKLIVDLVDSGASVALVVNLLPDGGFQADVLNPEADPTEVDIFYCGEGVGASIFEALENLEARYNAPEPDYF